MGSFGMIIIRKEVRVQKQADFGERRNIKGHFEDNKIQSFSLQEEI